jgi:NAD(P)H-hydrate epimerase
MLLAREQMEIADKYTIETIGIPSMVLMERAALAIIEVISRGDKG